MNHTEIEVEELEIALRRSKNWKSPGPEGVQNFWFKKFTSVHTHIARNFNKILNRETPMPSFCTKGITYLIPKDGSLNNVANYRLITCLTAIYKMLTSIISERVWKHREMHHIFPTEQRGSRECKELITIDAIITQNSIKKQRNLSVAYIDYRKAFDNIPHSYLLEVLKLYGIHPKIVSFFTDAMCKWITNVRLGNVKTKDIGIKRGIFQGDTFSPLWFCLSLCPLGRVLNESSNGYRIKCGELHYSFTRLLYMDDLKLFA